MKKEGIRFNCVLASAFLVLAGGQTARATPVATVLYQIPSSVSFERQGYVIANGGQVAGAVPGQYDTAALFTSNGTLTSLAPGSGYTYSWALGTDGNYQVGNADTAIDSASHAILWNGTAASYTDLQPPNLSYVQECYGIGVGGGQEVGYGTNVGTASFNTYALLWQGANSAAIDLTPSANFSSAEALATDGTVQGGMATPSSNPFGTDAVVWHGTAASIVNVAPAGYEYSLIEGVGGGQEVGGAAVNASGNYLAYLWNGTNPGINLNPTGYDSSTALGTNGTTQVGYGYAFKINRDQYQALMWTGSAASAFDLSTVLPTYVNFNFAQAYSVNGAGDIYGLAQDSAGNYYAIEWSPAAPLPGDTNMDGTVDSTDLTALMNGEANHLTGWVNGDFNQDGVINADDWALFDYGVALSNQAAASVPEPAAVSIMLIAGTLIGRRRKQ